MGDNFDSDDDFTSQDESENLLDSGAQSGDSGMGNKQTKQKCDARRRLELKLEEQRVKRQIRDYDFDAYFDDDLL